MAKDKEKKVKEKDGGKTILMIGVILIVCSIVLASVSVFMLTSSLKKLNTENREDEKDPDKIPLSQIESIETENIILILPSSTDSEKRMNFTFYVGFALDKESKDLTSTKELLEANNGIVKSKITSLLNKKYLEDMLRPDIQQLIADEIFAMMKEELQTDALVEIYIKDYLYR